MPTRTARSLVVLGSLAAVASAGLVARSVAAPATRPAATAVEADGYTPIFDGKTLAGWTAPDMTFWRVEDGAITGEVTADHKPKQTLFLRWTGPDVADFELKFQFRIFGKESNSGMQFRSTVDDEGLVHGYQADIDGPGKYAAGIWDEFGPRNSLAARGQRATWDAAGKKTVEKIADPFAAEEGKAAEPGKAAGPDLTQWTEYHIVAKGDHVVLKVNGKVACELTDHDKKRKCSTGLLAVPVITKEMKVQYRDLRLKRL